MRTKREDNLLLRDIQYASMMLEQFTSDLTYQDIMVNVLVQSACSWQLIVIGEAVRRLSESLKSKYHLIPWSDIVMNRNYLAHNYDTVSWKILWDTITEDAIPLRAQISEILKEEFPDSAF